MKIFSTTATTPSIQPRHEQKAVTRKNICEQVLNFIPLSLIEIIIGYDYTISLKDDFIHFKKITDSKPNKNEISLSFTKISEDYFARISQRILKKGILTIYTKAGEKVLTLPGRDFTVCAALGSNRFLTGDTAGSIKVWDSKNFKNTKTLTTYFFNVMTVFLPINDCTFFAASLGFSIKKVEETQGVYRVTKTFTSSSSGIKSLVFLPEKNYLIGKTNWGIQIWDANNEALLHTLTSPDMPVLSLTALGENTFFSVSTRMGRYHDSIFYSFHCWDPSKFLDFRKYTRFKPQQGLGLASFCGTQLHTLDAENILFCSVRNFGIFNLKTGEFLQHPEITDPNYFTVLSESLFVVGKRDGSFSLYAYENNKR